FIRLIRVRLLRLLFRFTAEWCAHAVDKSCEVRVRALLVVIDEHEIDEEEQEQQWPPLSPTAYAQQARTKQQPATRPPTRHGLELDVLQERRQHVLFFLMMPCVEPDGTKLVRAQIGPQQIHQRTLARAPLA